MSTTAITHAVLPRTNMGTTAPTSRDRNRPAAAVGKAKARITTTNTSTRTSRTERKKWDPAATVIITTKAIHELHRTGGRYALVTMCIGGGQGIAAIFEAL